MLTLCLIPIWLLFLVGAADDSRWEEGAFHDIAITDTAGEVHSPVEGKHGLVVVFVTCDCPIANAYQPELSRLFREYHLQDELSQKVSNTSRGIDLVLIHANPETTAAKAEAHRQDYQMANAVAIDPDQIWAKRFEAKVSPQAFLLDDHGTLLYSGRIDDLYVDFGKKRAAPTCRDLREAIEQWSHGQPIANRETQAIGCRIRIKD